MSYGMAMNDPLSVKLRRELQAVAIDSTIYAVAKLCLTMHPAFVYEVCFNDATPLLTYKAMEKTSIDVLPSKNQALCKYCTLASKLKHC